eukprot:gene8560-11442_t
MDEIEEGHDDRTRSSSARPQPAHQLRDVRIGLIARPLRQRLHPVTGLDRNPRIIPQRERHRHVRPPRQSSGLPQRRFRSATGRSGAHGEENHRPTATRASDLVPPNARAVFASFRVRMTGTARHASAAATSRPLLKTKTCEGRQRARMNVVYDEFTLIEEVVDVQLHRPPDLPLGDGQRITQLKI